VNGSSKTQTMLQLKVSRANQTALHEQVAGEIRRAIADGEAKPGERLPPARDFAAVLGVNTQHCREPSADDRGGCLRWCLTDRGVLGGPLPVGIRVWAVPGR
jgi:hypothetical protein